MEKKTSDPFISCEFLRNSLYITTDMIAPCCTPNIWPYAKYRFGEQLPVTLIKEKRLRIEDDLNSGRDCPCTGCHLLEKRIWRNEPYFFNHLNIGKSGYCNLGCIYCSYDSSLKLSDKRTDIHPILPIIADAFDRGLCPSNTQFVVGMAEPLRLFGIDKFVKLVMHHEQTRLFFASNLSTQESTLDPWVEKNRVFFTTSIDSGTRETYLTIKRRDLFNTVSANIQYYAHINPSSVTLKFICLPQNMNDQDAIGFFRIITDNKLLKCVISTNNHTKLTNMDNVKFMGKMKSLADYYGIEPVFEHRMINCNVVGTPYPKIIDAVYQQELAAYTYIPTVSNNVKRSCGWIEKVERGSFNSLQVSGWAYDKTNEQPAQEVAVFWRGEPIFAGSCRISKEYVRHGVNTGFYFFALDPHTTDAVLTTPTELTAYGRFGAEWVPLSSVYQRN